MLDIKLIRDNTDLVREGLRKRGINVSSLEELLDLDNKHKAIKQKIDVQRAESNKIAEDVAKNRTEELIERGRIVKSEIQASMLNLKDVETALNKLLLEIPNIPVEGVPEGDPSNFKILRTEGLLPQFTFTPKDHIELGELLDIIDIPRASKVSGSRFAYLKNRGVLLELALVRYAIDVLIREGFIPVIPPVIIRKDITDGLGYWQGKIDANHTANENYYLVYDPKEDKPEDNPEMYLIGTGEHALVPMHKDEVLNADELPKKYTAYSPCFRREAGSYGKDTKGILRVHQFDKVEMVEFVRPEDDEKERQKMLSIAEELVKSLGLPYQIVKLAAGDISFPAAETIDIETWIPSQGRYRETHSISTTTDFQSRRLNIRYSYADFVKHKPSNPAFPGQIQSGFFQKHAYVHILNGTAFAIGRMIIAILENFQQKDGSVTIPEVLQKYTGFSEIKPK